MTKLIIQYEHERLCHAGSLATLASIRTRFWPLSGRDQVRQVTRKCFTCARMKPLEVNPIMGNLPGARLMPGKIFRNTGVDYAGPILIKDGKTKNRRLVKAYIALFICFTTKAIHLELVSDLTSATFLGALKRFIARRGMPENIYSDNGSNFVGANRELSTLFESSEFGDKIITYLSTNNINWHFIPARAPHFGGLWEAGVKSTKFHLKRVLSHAHMTFEEMYTVLAGIEACLNSRPLCPLSDDPNDLEVLTPGHFLVGAPLTSIPGPQYVDINVNRLSRWQRLTQIQHFWQRWAKEYLCQLQERTKWQQDEFPRLDPGTLVLLKDSTPPLTWRRGRVVAVHPGDDGCVRVVSVKLGKEVVRRAARTLCVLPGSVMGN